MMRNHTLLTILAGDSIFPAWYQREPLLARFTLVVLALILFLLIAANIDERTLNGINVRIMPLNFNIAIVLYLGTLT